MKLTAISLQQTRTRLSMTPNRPKITDNRNKSKRTGRNEHGEKLVAAVAKSEMASKQTLNQQYAQC